MQENQLEKTIPSADWEAAEQEGFDMSLVEENLRLSVWERIRMHNRALATAVLLREAMENQNAGAGL